MSQTQISPHRILFPSPSSLGELVSISCRKVLPIHLAMLFFELFYENVNPLPLEKGLERLFFTPSHPIHASSESHPNLPSVHLPCTLYFVPDTLLILAIDLLLLQMTMPMVDILLYRKSSPPLNQKYSPLILSIFTSDLFPVSLERHFRWSLSMFALDLLRTLLELYFQSVRLM